MSDKINDGGSAFPWQLTVKGGNKDEISGDIVPLGQDVVHQICGMSLRDWFAGMALQGYIASVTQSPDPDSAAEKCFDYADAMLVKREKGHNP